MRVIGLTGGMGMGKSTAAAAFRRARIPVFDADAAVRQMQARGGRAIPAIQAEFPGTIRDGTVDRDAMRKAVLGNPEALAKLERIIHPMVREEERAFIARARRAGHSAVVLDIPLLFETGGDQRVDLVVVVSAPRAVQEHRLRRRESMSEGQITVILDRQMLDAERRRRADVVVSTGLSRRHALRRLQKLIVGLGQ